MSRSPKSEREHLAAGTRRTRGRPFNPAYERAQLLAWRKLIRAKWTLRSIADVAGIAERRLYGFRSTETRLTDDELARLTATLWRRPRPASTTKGN